MSDDLDRARERIDAIDREIVRLLAERMRAVADVVACKRRDPAIPLRDPERERAVTARWRDAAAELGLDPDLVEPLVEEMLRLSRLDQRRLLDGPER